MKRAINRRRMLSILAVGAGVGVGMGASGARSAATSTQMGSVPQIEGWEGRALGGDASIQLLGFSSADRNQLVTQCVARLRRLEAIFSLYDPNSDLVYLNREGELRSAPHALLEVLNASKQLHTQTGGAFDPTVQSLWNAAAAHFQLDGGGAYQPCQTTLAKVGFENVHVVGRDISLSGGAQLTFNGIAQGYITDQITELLQQAGARHVLVNLGEFRALGPQPDGHPWQIGIRDPDRIWNILKCLPLSAGAIATSAASGHQFEATGLHHHLFDPATGKNTQHYKSLSVWAPSAAKADGLSTAFSAMAEADIQRFVDADTNVGILLQQKNGRIKRLGNWSASAPSQITLPEQDEG